MGRETSNPKHPTRTQFSLQFPNLSPYAVMEILELNEAQQQRYIKAYDIAKNLLSQLKIFPTTKKERDELVELDEMERGYPSLTLAMMYDVVRACAHKVAGEEGAPPLQSKELSAAPEKVMEIVRAADTPSHVWSWRVVQGRLSRLLRVRIFRSIPAVASLDRHGPRNTRRGFHASILESRPILRSTQQMLWSSPTSCVVFCNDRKRTTACQRRRAVRCIES